MLSERTNAGAEERCSVRTRYVKGLTAVLQCMRSGAKQVCAVTIAADGLTFRWEDESKTLQCSVNFKAELFAQFDVPQGVRHVFGLQLSQLLDTLAVFATAPPGATLALSYPGPHGEMSCEMQDDSYDVPLVTYARLGAVELPESKDLTDYWETPTAHFLAQGGMLREVVEDLEFPSGDVQLSMWGAPPRLTMSATGVAGDLQVELPCQEFTDFKVPPPSAPRLQQPGQEPEPDVQHAYPFKAMKAAFCSLPSLGGAKEQVGQCSTKVSIDSNGLLKVTHMVGLLGGDGPQGRHGHYPGGPSQGFGGGPSAVESQHWGGTAQTAVVTFVMVPKVDGLE